MKKMFRGKEKEIRRDLVEMYMYYFKQARRLREAAAEDQQEKNMQYDVAKADGAVEAIAAIFMNTYGMRETYNLWQIAQAACEHEEMKNGERRDDEQGTA